MRNPAAAGVCAPATSSARDGGACDSFSSSPEEQRSMTSRPAWVAGSARAVTPSPTCGKESERPCERPYSGSGALLEERPVPLRGVPSRGPTLEQPCDSAPRS